MMGWAMLVALALAAAAFLALIRFPRRLWTIAATGLTLGAAGYAWQGSPSLAGHPVSTEGKAGEVDADQVALREAMFGKYGTYLYAYATAAESMIRAGQPESAVAVWIGAVRKFPGDAGLWTGLGTALSEHDGVVSPAAQLAFAKALALAPQHPGPAFFLGLALIKQGKFAEARPYWAKAAELAPEKVSYRDELRVRLFLLDRYLAEQAGAPPAAPTPTP